jgi:hypothetical protein
MKIEAISFFTWFQKVFGLNLPGLLRISADCSCSGTGAD